VSRVYLCQKRLKLSGEVDECKPLKLGCPLPISCQNDFSILNQTYEEDTYEAAYRFGVVGLPYGPLAGGRGLHSHTSQLNLRTFATQRSRYSST